MSPETTERVSLSIIVVNGQSRVSSVLREIREGKKVFAFAEVLADGRALSPRGDPEPWPSRKASERFVSGRGDAQWEGPAVTSDRGRPRVCRRVWEAATRGPSEDLKAAPGTRTWLIPAEFPGSAALSWAAVTKRVRPGGLKLQKRIFLPVSRPKL